MKNTKKILSIILSICMLLSITAGLDFSAYSATLSSSGSCGENVTYTFNSSTGKLVISGTGDIYDFPTLPSYLEFDIKSIIINDGVTSIGKYAFSDYEYLTSVKIGNSVTRIDDFAFRNCKGLTSVTIPDSVTSIGESAFAGCTGLTNITIPNSVTSIGKYAFNSCSLTKVNISSIDSWCKISFGNSVSNPLYCVSNLYLNDELVTDLVIPDSVTSIGGSAFEKCKGLTSVTIPDSVTSIGSGAFRECKDLTNITIPNSVTRILSSTFFGCTSLTSVTIPNSVTSIGDDAFYDCTGLTNITIPNSVTSIGGSAFEKCTGLTSVTIPDSVTSIGNSAFEYCTGIKELTMPASAKIYNSEYTFNNCSNIEKVTLTRGTGTMQNYSSGYANSSTYYEYTPWYINRNKIKEIVIEDGVTNIGEYGFCGCYKLTSVTIPNSVTSIGDSAFRNCSSLTKIVIPSSVEKINNGAFMHCTSLETVELNEGLKTIDNNVFKECNIKSIAIPSTVSRISSNFGNSLKEIYFYNPDCLIDVNDLFNSSISNPKIYGYDNSTASSYAKSYDIEFISLGCNHAYIDVPVLPTCTTKGCTVRTCTICKDTLYQDYVDALGHSYSVVETVNPTCSNMGYTIYECSVCKNSYVDFSAPVPTTPEQTVTTPTTNTTPAVKTVKLGSESIKPNANGEYVSKKATKPVISKLAKASKSFKITWKKVKSVSGYQIQYSTSSKFTKKTSKKVTYSGNKSFTKTVKKLKGNKKYYVRVRTYKTVKQGGKTYKVYSGWSKVKTVTTKK